MTVKYLVALLLAATAVGPALAVDHFWVGDNGANFADPSWQTFDSQVFGFPRTNPGAGDQIIVNNRDAVAASVAAPTLQIDSSTAVDAVRVSDGAAISHTAGTLTLSNTPGTVVGLWVGEFGPLASTYTLNGGSISSLDTNVDATITPDGLIVGNGGPGIFDFQSGSIDMTAGGGVIIGLDADATWNQPTGTLNARKVDIGLFASPQSTVNLSGDASWQLSDGLLLSDGAGIIIQNAENNELPPPTLRSDLNISGSSVSLNANGLIVREQGNLSFVADAGGVSPIVQAGGLFEIGSETTLAQNGSGLAVDLSAYGPTTDTITLIDGVRQAVGEFAGLPEGASVPNSGGRVITYIGGPDGLDVSLVPAGQYSAPPTASGPIARWSMDLNPNAPGPFPEGNPKVLDSRTATGEGVSRASAAVTTEQDDLWFFSADNNHTVVTSNDVPPTNMFANGNSGGAASYDAGGSVPSFASEGALFFAQDIYGDELSFTDSFSIEMFFKTSDVSNVQQLMLQGQNFARFGLTLNEGDEAGGVRFFVNDGTTIETIDIGGAVEIGETSYANDEWHYLLATFEDNAGTDGTGVLTLSIADEDGTFDTVSRDLPSTFLGLPEGNDGNLFIGAENFDLDPDGDGPRRFAGLIDEVQITAGIVSPSERLGLLGGPPSIPGDFDGDGDVDGADFGVFVAEFQTGDTGGPGADAPFSEADFNESGFVDGADFGVFVDSFQNFPPNASTAIPEPASALLALTGMLCWCGSRSVRASR